MESIAQAKPRAEDKYMPRFLEDMIHIILTVGEIAWNVLADGADI